MLTVHNELTSHTQAMQLYGQAMGVLNPRRADVAMFFFWLSDNPQENTFLGTSGAGPCTIILVHAANGTGALGHYGGTAEAWHILSAVAQMVHALDYPVIDTILFSAGSVDTGRKQKLYETTIIGGCRKAYPNATVLWPVQPAGDTFGACIYQPSQGVAALYESMPGWFPAAPQAQYGLRSGHFFESSGPLR